MDVTNEKEDGGREPLPIKVAVAGEKQLYQ
jgi:hypothetical protein